MFAKAFIKNILKARFTPVVSRPDDFEVLRAEPGQGIN
jgi:hypothetical protein